MEVNNSETLILKDEVGRCESIEELADEIMPKIEDQKIQWARKINEIMSSGGFTQQEFADLTGVSRISVNKWCKGSVPKNREMFLRIGMAAGYDRKQLDQLLQRYGQYSGLYPKSLEDCVCLFVIDPDRGYGRETVRKFDEILGRIRENIVGIEDESTEDLDTEKFDEKLSSVREEGDLEKFIADNTAVFSTAYNRLFAYVDMFIQENYLDYVDPVFGGEKTFTLNEVAEDRGWSLSLQKCIYEIKGKNWYPTRNKIISIGLYLCMTHQQIDGMLEMAHMEPLCARNISECVIMFILDDAELNDIMNRESKDFDGNNLILYAKEVMEKCSLPDKESYIIEVREKKKKKNED